MRRLLGLGAVFLGGVGVLVGGAAIGLGWWAASKADARVTRAAARLDSGLGRADAGLARTEERLAAVRADLDAVRGEAEKLAADNPELPRARAAIERLLDRFAVTIDRAAVLADALRAVAEGLRTAAAIRDLFLSEPRAPDRARAAADAIVRAADALGFPREKIDAVKSSAAAQLVRALVALVREAAAGSERLAEGLTDARLEVAAARAWTVESRERIVYWAYIAAGAHTLVWLWIGSGQLCLIGWGRRRLSKRSLPPPAPAAAQPGVS